MQGTRIMPERFAAVSHGQSPLISMCSINQHGVTFYLITWSSNN